MNRKILLTMNAENFFVPMWVKAYLEADFELDVISRYDIRKNQFYDQIKSIAKMRGDGRVRVIKCQTRFPGGFPVDYLRLSIEIPNLIRSEKYDALHVHGLEIRGIGALLSKTDNLILSPYGSDIFDRDAWGHFIPRMFPDILIRQLLNRSKLILPTSRYMEGYIHQRFGVDSSKIFSKSWGIDLVRWSERCNDSEMKNEIGLDEDAIVFLSYRSAKSLYQIHILPKIHSLLEKAGINAFFIYCMNSHEMNPYVQTIVESVTKRGLRKKSMFFFEPLADTQLRCLLDVSDYFFSIPKWDQLSSSLLEGLYREVIPIIPPLPAYKELLQQGCKGVIANSTYIELTEAIVDGIKRNIHTNSQILSKNKSVVEKFHDRERNFQDIMNKISNVISQ